MQAFVPVAVEDTEVSDLPLNRPEKDFVAMSKIVTWLDRTQIAAEEAVPPVPDPLITWCQEGKAALHALSSGYATASPTGSK